MSNRKCKNSNNSVFFTGKVVIDAFRLINPNMMVLGQEPRQTTSNLGHLQKPSIQVCWFIANTFSQKKCLKNMVLFLQALIHGLNRHYYSISINYRKNELEQKMLWNLHKKSWTEGLSLAEYEQHCKSNEQSVRSMLELAKTYNKVNI